MRLLGALGIPSLQSSAVGPLPAGSSGLRDWVQRFRAATFSNRGAAR